VLKIIDLNYYNRVVAFADKTGQREALNARLDYLRTYADPDEKGLCVVELSPDFAPASFYLLWQKNGKTWMNGGLIYHGDQTGWKEGGSYVNPLSVNLVSDDNPWSIHT